MCTLVHANQLATYALASGYDTVVFTYYCRLVDQGYGVVGVELAETAAKQFFEEQNIKCTQHKVNDDFIIYEVI